MDFSIFQTFVSMCFPVLHTILIHELLKQNIISQPLSTRNKNILIKIVDFMKPKSLYNYEILLLSFSYI